MQPYSQEVGGEVEHPHNFRSQEAGDPLKEYVLTKPGKVESNLLSKVPADMIQRLIFLPLTPPGPIMEKNLPLIK